MSLCLVFTLFSLTFVSSSVSEKYFAQRFIVIFSGYFSEQFRQQTIKTALSGISFCFSFVPRNYSHGQVIFPTDFELIETVDLNQNDLNLLTSRLLRSEFIKNVHKDKVIHLHVSQLRQDPNRKKSKKNPLPNDQAADSVLLNPKNQPWKLLSAPQAAWSTGLCGDGVRVGIFDTGLVNAYHYSHFRNANIVERTNWTWRLKNAKVDTNPSAVDGHGHGTFVSGLIAASIPDLKETSFSDDSCLPLGLAPHAELYIFRVFTDSQFSMTSWFLDALNYAIAKRLHVINLSIGGPDFMDQPFVDKVNELSANGILMVSAIGNDGPVFGSPNNPADQMDVLGVGGVDALGNVATFSSRGPTAWEMRDGYGRFKPDIVTWATGVISSNLDGGCKSLSGTSAASPVVTGSVALLINAALSHRPEGRDAPCPSGCPPINPASLKQAIMAGAGPISVEGRKTASIFEQGAGMLNLQRSIDIMRRMTPQASLWPSYLDLTDCPYFWPYCSQPLYATGFPVVVNVTIINSMGVYGRVVDTPVYHPYVNRNGLWLDVGVTFSRDLWPWTGHLALHLAVRDAPDAAFFDGIAEGYVSLKVESIESSTKTTLSTELKLPIRVKIAPTPKRQRRILIDYFHNIRYPSAYVPGDDLTKISGPLDWLGDHIHTNLRGLYQPLRQLGYFVEVLQKPLTCFNASNYGTLMIIDPEDEFAPNEIKKVHTDVHKRGLSLVVFAGWFNASVQEALKFYDANTKRLWVPITGGSNIPALNDLLSPFAIKFADNIVGGSFKVGDFYVNYPSGTHIVGFPTTTDKGARGLVLRSTLVDVGAQIIDRSRRLSDDATSSFDKKQKALFSSLRLTPSTDGSDPRFSVLGLLQPGSASRRSGRLGVFGDSNCLDSTHSNNDCFWLVKAVLDFVTSGRVGEPLASALEPSSNVPAFSDYQRNSLLKRLPDSRLEAFSRVIRHQGSDSRPPVYRRLPPCQTTPPRALVAPVSIDREVVYQPQQLRLRPPPLEPRKPISREFWCPPNRPLNVSASIHDSFLALQFNPYARLVREYFWFLILACCLVLLLLNLRCILEFLTFRSTTRCLRDVYRCLRGRPRVAVGDVKDDEGFLFLRSVGRHQDRQPIAETVLTTLPLQSLRASR